MPKKVYTVKVITVFRKDFQIEAESPDDARVQAEKDYLDDAIDTDDIDTEIEVYG